MAAQPKLLDRVRAAIRTRHYSRRTEDAYVYWIRRYIVFHKKVHPSTIGAPEIASFVTWLAVEQRLSASTQNQALCAVLFLYRDVLQTDVGPIALMPRARMPTRLPVVLSREEVGRVLGRLTGTLWIVAALLYGAGLRLQECLELRVKDVDFDLNQLLVRRGKGQKDRRTMLPGKVSEKFGACGRDDDDGLHARAESGSVGCAEPGGSVVKGVAGGSRTSPAYHRVEQCRFFLLQFLRRQQLQRTNVVGCVGE